MCKNFEENTVAKMYSRYKGFRDANTLVAQLYWPIPINAELANAKRPTFFLHCPMSIYSELVYTVRSKNIRALEIVCVKKLILNAVL